MVRYICTNCTRQTPSLYKVYSTPGSIQLTSCQSCNNDVDLYVEREWLLVAMDCILHRPEAFRHVLYNRAPFCHIITDDGTWNCSGLFQMSIATYALRLSLWYVLESGKDEGQERNMAGNDALQILLRTFIGDFVLITCTILTGMFIIHFSSTGETRKPKDSGSLTGFDSSFIFRICLAIVMPNVFHAITLSVSIWENSSTVCMLGTLFVLSLQRMGVSMVMEERCRNRNIRKVQVNAVVEKEGPNQQLPLVSMYYLPSFPFMLGMMIHLALQYLFFGKLTQIMHWDVSNK